MIPFGKALFASSTLRVSLLAWLPAGVPTKARLAASKHTPATHSRVPGRVIVGQNLGAKTSG
eukprot:Skav204775  [mRNA]  locus=scaffold763:43556:43741:- [translate_table: standard]